MNSSLEGIIAYLTKKFGGHVIDRRLLELLQTYPLRQIADFEKQDYFFTKDQPNS
jgi:hypothetical protein